MQVSLKQKLFQKKSYEFLTPFLPYLFAWYVVLSYLPTAYFEATFFSVFLTLILISVAAALVVSLLYLFVKDRQKRGLIAVVIIFDLLCYSAVSTYLRNSTFLSAYLKFHIIPLLFFIVTLGGIVICSRKNFSRKTFLFFHGLLCLLMIISLFQVIQDVYEVSHSQINQDIPQLSSTTQPSIYYLLFDEYTGPKALSDLYNYNDSSLTSALTARNFYFANLSTSNYYGSLHSIDSVLNLDYLRQYTQPATSKTYDPFLLESFIQQNKVALALKNSGYAFYQVGSWWTPSRTNINATENIQVDPNPLHLPIFSNHFLIDTTIVQPIYNYFYNPISTHTVEGQVEAVEDISKKGLGPKFVFAHILLPHSPNIFGSNCQDVSAKQYSDKNQQAYLDQVTCTNKTIISLVDTILQNSSQPPIIVVQSDEGDELKYDEPDSPSAPKQAFEEKYSILNAFYFPDHNYGKLYPTISAVNTFRLIFSQYFGAALPLLPDKNRLLTNNYSINNAVDVTSIVKNALGIK